MGKRSRQRVGARPDADDTSAPPREAAQHAGVVERAKASWKVAAEHAPDKDLWATTSQVGPEGGPKAARRARREAARDRGPALAKRPTRLDRRGERPPSPFGRWPVTEVMTLVGLLLLGLGLAGDVDSPLVKLGIILVALAAIESTVREHLFGYRSHAIFLGLMVVLVVHLVVVLVAGSRAGVSDAMFGVDAVLFAVIAWRLHEHYQRRSSERPGALRRSTPRPAGGR